MKQIPLWQKIGIASLIALYFALVFSSAYGWRMKQTDIATYNAIISKMESKYIRVHNKTVETSTALLDTGATLWNGAKQAGATLSVLAIDTVNKQSTIADENVNEPEITPPVDTLAETPQDTDEVPKETEAASEEVPEETKEPESYTDEITGETILTGGAYNMVYYSQIDPRWKDKYYGGRDIIGTYGCGPTTLSMLVSSLTPQNIQPDAMAKWANDNGFFCNGNGSYHGIIPQGAAKLGLKVENLGVVDSQTVMQHLLTGKIVVALMDPGHFTDSGHFLILRGTTLDGKVLICDPLSLENSLTAWDIDTIINELKTSAAGGGPLWSISN